MKRYLYFTHRWLGIMLSLFMAMWFISGVVMMYVGYPKLTIAERLSALPKLDSGQCCVDLNVALLATGQQTNPESLRVTTVGGSPRFIINYSKTKIVAVNGVTGQKIAAVSESEAIVSAQAFLKKAGEYAGHVEEDPWTHSRALDGLRPLHRVQMQDADKTLLYVSNTTGEVVRDATGTERYWNWIGAWIHWLYPFRGGLFEAQAANIVIYSSLVGCLVTITGIVVGLLRWRFTGQYKRGSKTPYRESIMRWHHLFGLTFGLITFTWILSGLLSMNPWKIFDSDTAKLNMRVHKAGEIDAQHFPLSIQQALASYQMTGFYPAELEWRVLEGKGYYIGFDSAGQTKILLAEAGALPIAQFSRAQLESAAKRLMGSATLNSSSILTEYDAYYYQRAPHTMTGHAEKRLPMLRLKFDDPYETWMHIDPYIGALVKVDSYRRTSRWLFAFLHSWDWLPLLNRRPLWDVLLIAFSTGGLIISVSGIIIGWRRLGRKLNESGIAKTSPLKLHGLEKLRHDTNPR